MRVAPKSHTLRPVLPGDQDPPRAMPAHRRSVRDFIRSTHVLGALLGFGTGNLPASKIDVNIFFQKNGINAPCGR